MLNTNMKILKFYEKYMLFIGISGHFMFLLQAFKVISSKSADDVSLGGLCVAFFSMVSWVFYGILKKDNVLVKVNIFGLLASLTCIISILLIR